MLKFFKILLQFFLIVVLSLFLINNAFIISFEINDFIYSFSSSYFLIFFIVFFIIIFLFQTSYFKLKFKLLKFKISNNISIKEKGYESFVLGMIALANKDYKKANLESKKISKYLKDDFSLSLLLKSEIYKNEKKYEQLNNIYEEMTKDENTKNLGYRGMMERYLAAQDYHHAFIYGEKLFNRNPYIEKIYDTLVNIIAITNNWQQLLIITESAYSKKIINKKIYQENMAIGYFEIAKIKKDFEIKPSISLTEKALKLRKNFPPFVKLYIDLLTEDKQYYFAKKIIKKAWSENPHSEYKHSIINLAKHLNVQLLDFIKSIIGSSLLNEESKILYIEASIINKKWDEARSQIKDLIDIKPKKEVCLLMAKIEEGDTGDIQKINSWSLRARNGAEKKMWTCIITNKTQNEWTSLSSEGHFNSLEWKQVPMIN